MNQRWLITTVMILVLGSAWLWISRVPVDAQTSTLSPEPALGRVAPDFTLQTLDGDSFTLTDLRGTPVVLNFWATWCGPCRNEMPALQAAADHYGDEVIVVGVDQGESGEVVRAFLEEREIDFLIPMDAELEVGNRYNVRGMPTTFFIDEDGVIRQTWTGEMNSITLAEGIAQIWP